MKDHQKTKILAIKDEVNELHPLLNILLKRLPNVVRSEYTHGTTEWGADFVFSRPHPVLKHEQYVAVIAKVGKIAQDLSSIDRQIEECGYPRPFLGGKQKIRIDEIWVVTTDNITKGAQDKIYDKYKAMNISFVSGEQLVELINNYYPAYWEDTSLLTGEYLSLISAKNIELDQQLSLIQIADKRFYVEQDIYEYPRYEYRKHLKSKNQKSKQINIVENIKKNNFILVEGGAGSGKSKLLRYLVNHFSSPEIFKETNILPVWVTYKELYDQFESNFDLLLKDKLGKDLLSELSSTKINFLVLIDAFDEKNLKLGEQIDELSKLVTNYKSIQNLKVVLTSRYLSELDKSTALEGDISRVDLAPLSLNRTLDFIKMLCANLNLATRLIEDLKKSQLFREMPRSPIAAILLAKLINENPKDIPSSLTELYTQYVELTLGRWEIDKGLETQKEYQALDNILFEFAKYILSYEISFIPLGDAKDIVKLYLSNRNLGLNPDELFEKIEKRCEIISVDSKLNTLTFKHRSFAEFFYGKSLARTNSLEIDEKAFTPYWMNTVFFYLGALKDAPQIITKLSNLKPGEESARWMKLINMSNYLLAAYATPYNDVSQATTNIMVEASELFDEITSKKLESPFAKLSHMQLLQLMSYLMRGNYSYDFFKQSLEDSAIRIADGPLPDLIKAYALYFLNITYIELGAGDSFDIVLKQFTDNLPLDISLAIRHESENLKQRTDLMRKQDKRIRRLLKNNSALSRDLDKLYDNPINSSPKRLK